MNVCVQISGKVSNPYLYHKTGCYGIKLDGKQVVSATRSNVAPEFFFFEVMIFLDRILSKAID